MCWSAGCVLGGGVGSPNGRTLEVTSMTLIAFLPLWVRPKRLIRLRLIKSPRVELSRCFVAVLAYHLAPPETPPHLWRPKGSDWKQLLSRPLISIARAVPNFCLFFLCLSNSWAKAAMCATHFPSNRPWFSHQTILFWLCTSAFATGKSIISHHLCA